MRKPVIATMLALACAGACAADAPTLPGWMQGCWQQTGAEPRSVEQWSSPSGGLMLGMSKTLKGGKLTAFEFMRITQSANGQLTFIAQPGGVTPTTFLLLRHTAAELVFENSAHDFPQRVLYRNASPTLLHARIEGTIKGKHKAIDFPMRRVSCEAADTL
jgi:hypothetical protein